VAHDIQFNTDHPEVRALIRKGHPLPPRSIIKSRSQINGIRAACQLTKQILDQLDDVIKEGMTTDEINTWVHNETLLHGATPAPLHYKGFPKSICTSINHVICHGIPDDTVLKNGDILNVDVTCILNGFYGDSCRMYQIGNVSQKAKQLVDVTKTCLDRAIDAVKPYTPINVIGQAIEACAKPYGYGVVDAFGGHGIGCAFHEEPFIYHVDTKCPEMIMMPGMVFTIEPMINMGTPKEKILSDNWTAVTADGKWSAQWEHTILVTSDGCDVLTG
jgi:methionyl aminopeptidase